jgi:hypothetical protein
MTDDRMALKGLLEKASDTELLAGMLGFVADRENAGAKVCHGSGGIIPLRAA